ncbi:MAG: class I SAM-dependent methyltransferase [Acetobacteraceae bacterium]|nr:class I SAM-dependent methyltransferase [Acetobacteraceae bacterium]
MQHGPSRTTVVTAMHRAARLLLDDPPYILSDTFARAFAGYASDAELLDTLASLKLIDFPRMRTVFTLRSRYAEDELARAAAHGITQYLILGAGLDSFAYRRPISMAAVQVFEIDHPVSQDWKRTRVGQLGIAEPPELHHIPIDFERNTLAEGLREGSVDLGKPVFVSWLGTTQYLTTEAVVQTLHDIGRVTSPGSQIVLQFIVPSTSLADDEAALVHALAARAASLGEPWLSFFHPAEIEDHLHSAGFDDITSFDHKQATDRYLRGRFDCLSLPAYFHMMSARRG